MAHIRMIAQKQQIEWYYNKKAKVRPLKVGDYVLKEKTQAGKDPRESSPQNHGPYKITTAANKGSFQLETMEGKLLPNNWKIAPSNTSTSKNGRSPNRTIFSLTLVLSQLGFIGEVLMRRRRGCLEVQV